MLVSYIDEKKSGKKNVIVFSTMRDDVKIMIDHRKNSSIHTMYDNTKGVVNFVDLYSTTHSTRIKSRRWTLIPPAFIHEPYRPNTKVILQDNIIKLTNFEMTYCFFF